MNDREDRKERLTKQLKELNIQNIDRLSADTSTTTGPINCELSHRKCYQQLIDNNLETLLVLEDDCLFLEPFITNYKNILEDINNTDWDIFYFGARMRRTPLFYKNNCFRTSSTSHAHAYLIKKRLVNFLFAEYPTPNFANCAIDELLTLLPYGKEVVRDPNKFNFYKLDQPLLELPTNEFISLTYKTCLATQYKSFSSLWRHESDIEAYIASSYYGLESKCQ